MAQRHYANKTGGVQFALLSDAYSQKEIRGGLTELYDLENRIQQEETSMLVTKAINKKARTKWDIERTAVHLPRNANSINNLIAQLTTSPPITNGGVALIWFTGLSMTKNTVCESAKNTIEVAKSMKMCWRTSYRFYAGRLR